MLKTITLSLALVLFVVLGLTISGPAIKFITVLGITTWIIMAGLWIKRSVQPLAKEDFQNAVLFS